MGQFFAFFLLGYCILSKQHIIKKLEENCCITAVIWLIAEAAYVYLYCIAELRNVFIDGLYVFVGWNGVLALLGIAHKTLNFNNKVSSYLAKASFSIYMIHQLWVVIIGYFVLQYSTGIQFQFLIIMALSLLLTLFTYELVKRIPLLKNLFGIV